MASNQKAIYVYESFQSTEPNFLGTLFVENVRGRESYSFEYDADWLKSSANYMYLDPDLQLYAGRQYPTGTKNVFGLFADSSPDRWGRLLMTRRERILAEQEGRKPRKLLDSDFLMGVYDETRMGAIRFKLDKDGPFLSDDSETPTPPWTSLRTLEEASRQFENDESGLEQKWINQLIKPGSSLGGARPKATVPDTKGNLWIAKFPSKHDDVNVGAWEKVTHEKLETVLSSEDEIDQRIYKFPTSHIKVKNRKSSYFEVISSLQFEACNDALKRIVPRIDFNQINAKYRAAANFRHCLNLRRLCYYITSCNHFYSEIGYKLNKPPEGGFRYK